MGYHRAVEFFRRAPALAELEILHRVRAVAHGLQTLEQQQTGTPEAVHRLPVHRRGGGFHHHKGLISADAPHQIMAEGRVLRHPRVPVVPRPDWIIIPGGAIQQPPQLKIIDAGIRAHQIGGAGNIGRDALEGLDFPGVKIAELLRGEAFPGQFQGVAAVFPPGGGRFHLFKGGIPMGPEGIPPIVVELFDGAVAFL